VADPHAARLVSIEQSEPSTGIVVLSVTGELDASSANYLTGPLNELLDESAATHIKALIVDLEKVEFLGSAGLEALVIGRQRAVAQNIPFSLVATRRPVLRPISATGLDTVFVIKDSLTKAIAELPAH
jgi:anti-anti-sigma factor